MDASSIGKKAVQNFQLLLEEIAALRRDVVELSARSLVARHVMFALYQFHNVEHPELAELLKQNIALLGQAKSIDENMMKIILDELHVFIGKEDEPARTKLELIQGGATQR